MPHSHATHRRIAIDLRLEAYFKVRFPQKVAGEGPGIMRQRLLKALELLNAKLADAGAHMELWMIGGGTMMLHFNSRESSGDLDVIPRKGDFVAMIRFAEEVSREMTAAGEHLPLDWINGDFTPQLKTLHVTSMDFERDARYHWTNLDIAFAKPELMLALKCYSLRPEGYDRQDIRALMNLVPITNLDQFYNILERYGDVDMLADGDDVLLESMFKQVRSERPT